VSELEQSDRLRPEVELAADLLDKFGIPASAVVKYAYQRRERQAQRVAAVLTDAASRRGITVEHLMARAEEKEDTSDLLEQVLRASARARSTQHVRALARVLAVAVAGGDGTRLIELPVVVDTLDQLGSIEIRALHALHNVQGRDHPNRRLPGQGPERNEVWRIDVVARALGSPALAPPVNRSLEQLSLVEGISQEWTPRKMMPLSFLTPFGKRLLEFLSEHAPSD
jgi:hypothetical protein